MTILIEQIIAGNLGKERTWEIISGRVRAMPFTYLRISTDAGPRSVSTLGVIGRGWLPDLFPILRLPGLRTIAFRSGLIHIGAYHRAPLTRQLRIDIKSLWHPCCRSARLATGQLEAVPMGSADCICLLT